MIELSGSKFSKMASTCYVSILSFIFQELDITAPRFPRRQSNISNDRVMTRNLMNMPKEGKNTEIRSFGPHRNRGKQFRK